MRLYPFVVCITLVNIFFPSVKGQVAGQRNIQYTSAPSSLQSSVMVKGFGQSYIQTGCEYINGGNDDGSSFITKYDSLNNQVVSIKVSRYLIRGICEDANNNLYTIGIDAGTTSRVSMLKISSTGSIVWKKTIPQTDNSNTFIPDYYPYDFYKAVLLSNGNILFNCYATNSRSLIIVSPDGTFIRSADLPVIIGDIEQGFNNTITAAYFDRVGFFGDNVTVSGVIQFDYNLRIIRNKKITTPSSFFIYGVSSDKNGFYYFNGVDSSANPSATAGGIIIKLDSQLSTAPGNTIAFVGTSKKNCGQTNDGRFFKIAVSDHSFTVMENLFFISLQNSIIYNNNSYVSVPVLNFDTALNLQWSKNMFIRQDSLNPAFMVSDDIVEVKDNIIFSIRTNLNSAFLYYLDTAGNTGNCYHSNADFAVRKSSSMLTDTSFNTPVSFYVPAPTSNLANTITADPAIITLECVPPLKPISNFVTDYSNPNNDTSTICLNTAIRFIDSSKNDPAVFRWIFPLEADLSNADSSCFPNISNVFFTYEGIFPVQLIACNNFGCDTVTKYINTRLQATPPNLGNDTTICPGDSIALIYINQPNSNHEFTGSNGFLSSQDTIYITESGTYTCTVISDCGVLSDDITVTVLQAPMAAFTTNILCDALSISFTNNSETNGNTNPVYNWDFFTASNVLLGSSADENPVFTFPSFDSFRVQLSVSSRVGCAVSDSFSSFLYVKAKPVAAFTATTDCGNFEVIFNDNSIVAADTLQSWLWDFGNGQGSAESNPVFTFSTYGPAPVTLTTTSSRGCSDTVTQTVVIKEKPVVILNQTSNVCANNPFYIIATAGIADTAISNLLWWINDIPQGENNDSLQLIKPAGNYTVKNLAVSSEGCASDTAIKNIVVEEQPQVTAQVGNGCAGTPVNFSAQVLNGSVTDHQWYFGDGDSSTVLSGTHMYVLPGNFIVRYIATGANGCSSTVDSVILFIESIPEASFSWSNTCAGKTLEFSALASSNAVGNITNYNWIFDGTQTANGINVSFPPVAPGSYNATLTASTANGCSAEKTELIDVRNSAISAGNDAAVTANTPYTLQGNGAVSYQWQPAGLLDNALTAKPVATIKNDQLFILEATDVNGCKGYDSVFIKVIGNIFIPSAFNPSGIINQVWRIKDLADYGKVKLAVYNRYGQVVFEGSAANNYSWDGTYKNKPQPPGVYVYVVQINDGRRVKDYKGTVTLIR